MDSFHSLVTGNSGTDKCADNWSGVANNPYLGNQRA